MELVRLTLNTSDAGARRDLADPYEMHSTLARVFSNDAASSPAPFLWRLENSKAPEPPTLIVQSEHPGHWDALKQVSSSWCLKREARTWDPSSVLRKGQDVTFRIRCNPTVTRNGKRLGLWTESQQRIWFERQAQLSGLADLHLRISDSQRLMGRRRKGGGEMVTVCAAQFEGLARVVDCEALSISIRRGIGHAKMMGLGLLSIAPAH